MSHSLKNKFKNIRFFRWSFLKFKKLYIVFGKNIRGKNNIIKNKGVFVNVKFDIKGNNNLIEIGKGTLISDVLIYIRGDRHKLKIGENCKYSGGYIWFEDKDCEIKIEKYTTIEFAQLAVTEPNKSITIGEDCMLSGEIVFRTGDSHSIIDLNSKKRINYAENINIGNHVWIGSRATILKGANIADNCIIGINSIVTKSFPENSLIVGSPAKVIKENVTWDRNRLYE